jgi:hypothetical protein
MENKKEEQQVDKKQSPEEAGDSSYIFGENE